MVIKLLEEYEKWVLKINLEKNLILEDQKGCIRECEEFKYLSIKIDKETKKTIHSKNWINKGSYLFEKVDIIRLDGT